MQVWVGSLRPAPERTTCSFPYRFSRKPTGIRALYQAIGIPKIRHNWRWPSMSSWPTDAETRLLRRAIAPICCSFGSTSLPIRLQHQKDEYFFFALCCFFKTCPFLQYPDLPFLVFLEFLPFFPFQGIPYFFQRLSLLYQGF